MIYMLILSNIMSSETYFIWIILHNENSQILGFKKLFIEDGFLLGCQLKNIMTNAEGHILFKTTPPVKS